MNYYCPGCLVGLYINDNRAICEKCEYLFVFHNDKEYVCDLIYNWIYERFNPLNKIKIKDLHKKTEENIVRIIKLGVFI